MDLCAGGGTGRAAIMVVAAARHKIPKLCMLRFEIYKFRAGGGTGRRVCLRGIWRKLCGFKSHPAHQICFAILAPWSSLV